MGRGGGRMVMPTDGLSAAQLEEQLVEAERELADHRRAAAAECGELQAELQDLKFAAENATPRVPAGGAAGGGGEGWTRSDELAALRRRARENDAMLARVRRPPPDPAADEALVLLRKEVGTLQELCDEQRREGDALREQLRAASQVQARPLAVLLSDVAALRQVCADSVGQIEELNARLQEAKRRRLEEVSQLQEHVDAAMREHVASHSELQMDVERAEGQTADAEQALREAAAERDMARKQADSLRADLASLRAATARSAEELVQTAQATAAAAGAKALAAEEALAAKEIAEGRMKGLGADVAERQAELDKLMRLATQKEGEIDVAKQLCEERRQGIDNIKAQIRTLRSEAENSRHAAHRDEEILHQLGVERDRRNSGDLVRQLKQDRDVAEAALNETQSRGTTTKRRLQQELRDLKRQAEFVSSQGEKGAAEELTEAQAAEAASAAALLAAESARDAAAAANAEEEECVTAALRDLRRRVQELRREMLASGGDRRDLLQRLRTTVVQRNDDVVQQEGTLAQLRRQLAEEEAEVLDLQRSRNDDAQDAEERHDLLTLQQRLVEEKDRQIRLQTRHVGDAERRVQALRDKVQALQHGARMSKQQRDVLAERDRERLQLVDLAREHARRADAIEMRLEGDAQRADRYRASVQDDRRLRGERDDVLLLLTDSAERNVDMHTRQRRALHEDLGLPAAAGGVRNLSYRPMPGDRYSGRGMPP